MHYYHRTLQLNICIDIYVFKQVPILHIYILHHDTTIR